MNRLRNLRDRAFYRARLVRAWIRINDVGLLATGSLAAISAGFWLAWPPLGLIVPGSLVFACLVYAHLTGAR